MAGAGGGVEGIGVGMTTEGSGEMPRTADACQKALNSSSQSLVLFSPPHVLSSMPSPMQKMNRHGRTSMLEFNLTEEKKALTLVTPMTNFEASAPQFPSTIRSTTTAGGAAGTDVATDADAAGAVAIAGAATSADTAKPLSIKICRRSTRRSSFVSKWSME